MRKQHLKYLLKEKETPVYITACAVVIGKSIFVGNTHKECLDKARNVQFTPQPFQLGWLGTDGKYYDQKEASILAYANRQTKELHANLQPEDLFFQS